VALTWDSTLVSLLHRCLIQRTLLMIKDTKHIPDRI
jgi:hypothetical protein